MKKRDTDSAVFASSLPLKAMLQDLKPHDHICLIYKSHNEWKKTVIPFIAMGLKNRAKRIYIGNTHTDKEVRKQLKKEGIDTKKAEAPGQLAILDERETYIKKGSFDPDRIIKFFIRETNKALKEGYTALRVIGEMTWNGYSGSERLLEYESKLNRDFFPKYPCLGMCLYDRGKFDPEIIKGVILTHPYILIGNRIYRNVYYIPPEKYLRKDGGELEVDIFLKNIKKEYRTLESLKDREEQYRKLFEESVEGIVLADIDTGIIIDCNQALLKLVEREKDEVIGKPQKILHPPEDDIGNVSRTFEEHRKDKRGQTIETRVITKTGELKDVEIKANLANIKDRKVLQGIFHEITERKKMEETLRENEEKYRTIFENSVMGIFRTTPEGRYLSINPAGAKMYGYASEKEMMTVITDMAYQIYVNPEDRKRLRELLEKNNLVEGFESEHYTRDGQKIWVSMNVRAVRDKQGTIQYHETTSQDITARKLAEAQLRESERKYRDLFEHSLEGIFQTTPEGRFLVVNPGCASISGYDSPEEMMAAITDISKQLYVHPEDRNRWKQLIKEKGVVENFEHQEYRKDGTTIWVSLSARAIKDEEGNILYYAGNIEDITGRKEAEERLRKSLIGTINALSTTVETRDPYTAGHQKRVSALARSIAQEMDLSKDDVENIRMAGTIHDIGKISVPAEILSKPTKLTKIEMDILKVHPQTGYDILKDTDLPYPIAEMIYEHHERLNGSGYPRGLKNGEILLESLILAVADVVEAMSSHRPYRPALGIDAALEEIEKNKGILYHPEVVDACLKLFKEKGFKFE